MVNRFGKSKFQYLGNIQVRNDLIYVYLWNCSIEPIGSKAPTFSSDSMGSIFRRNRHTNFALLCQAQAYPVPITRLVYCITIPLKVPKNIWDGVYIQMTQKIKHTKCATQIANIKPIASLVMAVELIITLTFPAFPVRQNPSVPNRQRSRRNRRGAFSTKRPTAALRCSVKPRRSRFQ